MKIERMTELKPCPFCGKDLPYLMRWMEFYHPDTGDCIMDGLVIPDVEDAIEKWNRRVKE